MLTDDGERMVPEFHQGKLIYTEHLARYRFAAGYVRGKFVLDVASGSGYGLDLLKRGGALEVAGLDSSPQAVSYARSHTSVSPLLAVGDAQVMPFGDKAFDVVVSFETIEHVHDPGLFLAEIRRVLTPDGLLIISTPNKAIYPQGNPFHLKEFHVEEFHESLQGLFDNVNILTEANWLTSAVLPAGISASEEAELSGRMEALKLHSLAPHQAMYLVALCSDRPLPAAASSLVLTGVEDVFSLPELQHFINETRSAIQIRDAEIGSKTTELVEKASQLAEAASRLGALQGRLLSEARELVEAKAALQEAELASSDLASRLQNTQGQLVSICARPGFQALEGLRRLSERMAPWGSLRAKVLAALTRFVARTLS